MLRVRLSRCYVQKCLSPTLCGVNISFTIHILSRCTVISSVFYDFMTICANYTKTVVFCCAFCRMVSGLAVVWCRVLSWCGSVARCDALLASFYGFMVSSTFKALKWLCGRSGASGRVSRCRHGVGCLVSVSSLVVWCAVFWSSLGVSSLVWSSGVWS